MSQNIKPGKGRPASAHRHADSHLIRDLERRFQDGKARELNKDFAGAERIYREIVASFDRNHLNAATPSAALGYVLLSQRKFEDAERVLRRSVKVNPSILQGWANLAALYRLTERWRLCVASIKRALQINPKNVESLLNLAEAQKESRFILIAVAALKRVTPTNTGSLPGAAAS